MGDKMIKNKLFYYVWAALIPALVVVFAGWSFVSAQVYQPPTPKPQGTNMPSVRGDLPASMITIRNFAFDQSTLTIARGATVVWVNEDFVIHKIVSDANGTQPVGATFASPDLANGQKYSVTFNQAGEFSYHCSIYPDIIGKIIVQ